MASVTELINQRSGTNGEVQRRYLAQGYATEALAITAIHSAAPSTIGDLALVEDETSVDEIHYDGTDSAWTATVTWRLFEPSSGLNYSFQIGGTSIFRYTPIAQTVYWHNGTSSTSAAANNVGINWDGEEVQGVNLPEKSGFEFVIPARKPIADVDNTYVETVADLYLTVNNATFAGFPAGEVLFLGMSGSRVGESDWQLYYRFSRSDNQTSISVPGVAADGTDQTITVSSKEGWEYLWASFAYSPASSDFTVQKPSNVFVAQVFEDGDFTGLEL